MSEEYGIAEEIENISMGAPHVVILGAGASVAAFPKGDRDGRKLPLMENFIETLGLKSILEKHNIPYVEKENFEALYARISKEPKYTQGAEEVEAAIRQYFSLLELPDTPTIYDYLVLSLRGKDMIATFNWDPFLFDALRRNHHVGEMPHVAFLHGAINIGYCMKHRKKGFVVNGCPESNERYKPSRLLYPVEQKNYSDGEMIEAEWAILQSCLKRAYVFTVFGYSAPQSDVEAVKLLSDAWGKPSDRSLEEIEIIDIKPEEALRENWDGFIHTHHYQTTDDFFKSFIAKHPRRTCDAMWAQLMDSKFIDEHCPPQGVSLKELQEWYEPLIERESRDKETATK